MNQAVEHFGLNHQMCVANRANLTFTSSMDKVITDEQLMLQYAQGNMQAFEQLYARHKGGLYRYCLRQLNNQSTAEECFQEVWLKLINSRHKYQPKALFTTYLYRIAQNHIIDIFRRDKKSKYDVELDEASYTPSNDERSGEVSTQLIKQAQFNQLNSQIQQLPLEQKTALLLQLEAGFSLEEIATILDCGRETVKSRLRYATNRLKDLLGDLL